MNHAAIRLLIFNNRIEIINPGCLYGGLTVDDIKLGVSRQRNPQMADFAAKTMIYRGLSSGIVRAMREDNHIDFDNEVSANQFKVTIWRTTQKETLKDSSTIQKNNSTIQKGDSTIQKNLEPSQVIVLNYFKKHPNATIDETVAELKNLSLGGVKFIIGKLQQKGLLKRVGGRKHGTWQVLLE